MSRVAVFLGLIAAPVVWVAGVWLLADLITRWPALAPFVWIDTASSPEGLEWWVAVRTPMGFLLATSAVLLVELRVVVIHAGVNAVYQASVHSELHWRGRLWDAIWITPAAHRLHHSNRPDHFDHNFGILTVWDRVFGTIFRPIRQDRVRQQSPTASRTATCSTDRNIFGNCWRTSAAGLFP